MNEQLPCAHHRKIFAEKKKTHAIEHEEERPYSQESHYLSFSLPWPLDSSNTIPRLGRRRRGTGNTIIIKAPPSSHRRRCKSVEKRRKIHPITGWRLRGKRLRRTKYPCSDSPPHIYPIIRRWYTHLLTHVRMRACLCL